MILQAKIILLDTVDSRIGFSISLLRLKTTERRCIHNRGAVHENKPSIIAGSHWIMHLRHRNFTVQIYIYKSKIIKRADAAIWWGYIFRF